MGNSADLGPYRRAMPRALCWSYGCGQFLMREMVSLLDALLMGGAPALVAPAVKVEKVVPRS